MKRLLCLPIVATILLALPVSDLAWARDESVCSLRVTEIRPNPTGSDTCSGEQGQFGCAEGEWFEVTNFGLDPCTIPEGFGGGALRFTEKTGDGDVVRHLLNFDGIRGDLTLAPDETAIFAASPTAFQDTYPDADCQVRNITNRPGFNNDKDEVIVRDSPNDGDDDIDKLQYDFEGGVSDDRSVALLDVDGDGDGDPVLSLPTPCFPVACVPLFGILGDAECNIVP